MEPKTESAGRIEPVVSRLDRTIKRLEVGQKEYRFEPDKVLITIDHALQFLRAYQEETCEWSRGEDYDDETWSTECGQAFTLHEEATPTECEFHFCAYCGRKLKEQITRGECD
jgi:hypothetical protein